MDLTQEEIERYTPYDTMAKFAEGFADYVAGRKLKKWPGVFGRAYDRGAECAMRRELSLIGEISLAPSAPEPAVVEVVQRAEDGERLTHTQVKETAEKTVAETVGLNLDGGQF
jgi:hypothetical protein